MPLPRDGERALPDARWHGTGRAEGHLPKATVATTSARSYMGLLAGVAA